MRVWTEATFNAAIELDLNTQDSVIWLNSRSQKRRRLGNTLDAIDRVGNRVGRVTALIGFGFLACSAVPNSALAPVGTAHAAGERFKLQNVFPTLVEHMSEPTEGGVEPSRPVNAVTGASIAIPPGLLLEAAYGAIALAAPPQATVTSATAVDSPAEIAGPAATPIADVVAASVASAEIQHPLFEESRAEVEEYLRFGSREVPRRLVETIVRAAIATGVDPIYLMALADKESSFRPEVRASTSSAEGLFQFVERTWLDMVKVFGPRHGFAAEAALVVNVDGKQTIVEDSDRARILSLRRDPYVAAVMAAEMLRRDAARIGLKIGRELNATELYLAHFLGLDGAARFIAMKTAKKVQNATVAFPAAAKANASIFFERGKRGRRKGLSVPEVYAKIDRMIDARLDIFRPVKVIAAADSNS